MGGKVVETRAEIEAKRTGENFRNRAKRQLIRALAYRGNATSSCCTWLGVSRQPDAPQFSSVRATLLVLGMTTTCDHVKHQLSATCAGVLPASRATPSSASQFRPALTRGRTASEPSARGV